MKTISLFRIATVTAALLSIPLIAMLFTKEVQWNLLDFLVDGAIIASTGIAIEWIRHNQRLQKRKVLFIAIVLIFVALLWAELAVGLFGTPFGGN